MSCAFCTFLFSREDVFALELTGFGDFPGGARLAHSQLKGAVRENLSELHFVRRSESGAFAPRVAGLFRRLDSVRQR